MKNDVSTTRAVALTNAVSTRGDVSMTGEFRIKNDAAKSRRLSFFSFLYAAAQDVEGEMGRFCFPTKALPPSDPRSSCVASRTRNGLRMHRSLSQWLCTVLLLLCACTAAYAIDPLPFNDRAEEVRFQQLTRQLRCLVCQNQDLADSDADLAKDLRKQVFDMIRDGKSDAQIKQYLVARYNDFVLYDPPLKPGTWLLWFAPFGLVVVGAMAVMRILRQRSRAAVVVASGADGRSNQTNAGDDDW
jgi:cytochrome c-type biogenesis protein CcmH